MDKKKPETYSIGLFIVYTDSVLIAASVADKAIKAVRRGRESGFCVEQGRRVYWITRAKTLSFDRRVIPGNFARDKKITINSL